MEITRQSDYYGLPENLDKTSSYDKLAQEELDDLLAGCWPREGSQKPTNQQMNSPTNQSSKPTNPD
jgi:hypothetical protein